MNGGNLTIRNARLITVGGARRPRRGDELRDLRIVERGWVTIRDGRIQEVGEGDAPADNGEVLDAQGNAVLPAFVDCHTHACWAGDRFDEFELKLAGAGYLDILKAGGGIMSTVRAVRAADIEDLTDALLRRLVRMGALGTGTVEVKSGYGLTTAAELKMLRAVTKASGRTEQTLQPTFLGAHAIDPENDRFIDQTIEETLPAVVESFPGITCDAYCEQGAWSVQQTTRLFEAAAALGCPLRVHVDQFNSLGMVPVAIDMHARSLDHLEATARADLKRLAGSETIGVALPASGFHLDDTFAPARSLIDFGGAVAIATNYNPGSAPTPSIPFTIALACRKMNLTPAEAIVCSTYNAACVLGLESEVGSIEPEKRADLQVLDCSDERDLAFEFAGPGPLAVVINGRIVHHRNPTCG
jgi:imidazolonepropionase